MIKRDEFIARKKLLNGQTIEERGSAADLTCENALSSLSPIAIGEVFELELGEAVRLPKVMPGLTFDCIQSDEPGAVHAEEWANYVSEACDFESGSQESIVRIAIARKGQALWQLIGLQYRSEIKVLVQNPEDCYSASSRYFGDVIARNTWGSEGYGIGFEGSAALIEVGDFWVEAFDGDSLEPDQMFAKPTDAESGIYLAGWLEEQNAVLPAIFELFECKWSDPELRRELNLLIPEISKIAPRLLLTQSRTKSLKAALAKKDGDVGSLLRILRQPKPVEASKMLKLLREYQNVDDLKTFLSVDSFAEMMKS